MKRNLDRRVETVAPVEDPNLIAELGEILAVAENDNQTAWDLGSDGSYTRRKPAKGESSRPSQVVFMEKVK